MGDALWRFQNKLELRRNLLRPAIQNRFLGHAIERIINFDGAKAFTVEMKHLFIRQVLRIKRSLPLLVGIAAGADVEVHIFVPIHSTSVSNNSFRTSES